MPTDSGLEKVKELLGNGKTEDAADLLLEITKGADEVNYSSALMLKNQLEQHQQDVIDGVVSDSEQRLNWAKISRRIIELTRQVEKGEGPKKAEELPPPAQNTKPVTSFPKWALWGVPIVLLLGFLGVNYFTEDSPKKETPPPVTKQVAAIKTIPFKGNLIYNDGSPAGDIEVKVIPVSSRVSKLMAEIRFVTNADGTFTAEYPELMEENGEAQVNIYFLKNGAPIDKRINNRFMPINFKNMTIQTSD